MKTTTNLGLKKIELTDSPPDITVQDTNWDSIDKHLNTAVKFQKATGTGTAITLTEVTLEDGFQKTFIVKANNSGVATKINGKNLYRPGSTLAPTLIAGRAATVWYDLAGDCFFYKASAEGTALNLHVLAGLTFSNNYDTNIAGALAPRMPNLVRDSNYVAGVSLNDNWQTQNVVSASKVSDIIFTASGYGGGVFQQYTLDLSHKYFFSVSVTAPSQPESVCAQLSVKSGALNGKSESSYNYGGGTRLLQGVLTPNGNYTGEVSFMVYDARMSNYSAISFRNPMLIDLTEAFGVGKELDVYDMSNILATAGGWWNNNLKALTNKVDAAAGDLLEGKTAVVNGLKVTGTTPLNPRNIAGTVHSESLEPVVGAHSGDGKQRLYLRASTQRYAMDTDSWITREEPDLFPQNIVNGKKICGIDGTAALPEVLHNFPLSIQDAQPTPIREGHIWIKSSDLQSKVSDVYIVDYPRASDSNGIITLAVGSRAEMQTSFGYFKPLASGGTKWFGDGINTSSGASWVVSKNTNGMTQVIKYRPPMVYSKINGVLDIETAYMWNGTSWILLCQKGSYFVYHDVTKIETYNNSGDAISLSQTIPSPYSQYGSISKDGQTYTNGAYIFQRVGDTYTKQVLSDPYGYGWRGVQSCVTGDGKTIIVSALASIGGSSAEVVVVIYKFNGTSWAAQNILVDTIMSWNASFDNPAIATNVDGSAVLLAYKYSNQPGDRIYLPMWFRESNGTYSRAVPDIANLTGGYPTNYCGITIVGNRIILLGTSASNGSLDYPSRWSFTFNTVAKTVTFGTRYSLPYANTGAIDKNSAVISDDYIAVYNKLSSPPVQIIGVISDTYILPTFSGYTFTANDYAAGGSIAFNLNRTVAIMIPANGTYALVFSYNITNSSFTFIRKIDNIKIGYQARCFFVPN